MYQVQILLGIELTPHFEDPTIEMKTEKHELVLDQSEMPSAGNDLSVAKAEAVRYSNWNHYASRFRQTAQVNDTKLEWKERTVNKKKVHDLKYTDRPADELNENRYVIVRVCKA